MTPALTFLGGHMNIPKTKKLAKKFACVPLRDMTRDQFHKAESAVTFLAKHYGRPKFIKWINTHVKDAR